MTSPMPPQSALIAASHSAPGAHEVVRWPSRIATDADERGHDAEDERRLHRGRVVERDLAEEAPAGPQGDGDQRVGEPGHGGECDERSARSEASRLRTAGRGRRQEGALLARHRDPARRARVPRRRRGRRRDRRPARARASIAASALAVRQDAGVTLDETLALPDTELVRRQAGRARRGARDALNANPDVALRRAATSPVRPRLDRPALPAAVGPEQHGPDDLDRRDRRTPTSTRPRRG